MAEPGTGLSSPTLVPQLLGHSLSRTLPSLISGTSLNIKVKQRNKRRAVGWFHFVPPKWGTCFCVIFRLPKLGSSRFRLKIPLLQYAPAVSLFKTNLKSAEQAEKIIIKERNVGEC